MDTPVVKAPAGWERVLREAARLERGLREAVLLWADTVRGFLTIDEIVRAIEAGRLEHLIGEAIEAAGTIGTTAVLTEMAQAASRLAAGIVWDRVTPGFTRPTSGMAGPFTIDFARIDLEAARWALDHGGRLITAVSEETRWAVIDVISRAPVEGITVEQQARLIRQIVGLNSRQAAAVVNRHNGLIGQWQDGQLTLAQVERQIGRYEAQLLRQRAMMIARTETLNAARASQLAAWREAQAAGLIGQDAMWEWGASPDACPICTALDGTTYPMGEQGPDTHPNCRCYQTRVFPGDDGYAKAVIVKPLGRFPDFAACVTSMTGKLGSADAARRYCGALQSRIEGSAATQ